MSLGFTALGAVVSDDSVDLAEIADNRMRFREGLDGVITARYFVPERRDWSRIRLTYRRPGDNLRLENYIRASLIRIDRRSATADILLTASSETDLVDSDQIRWVEDTGFEIGENIIQENHYYYIEVTMRRAIVTPDSVSGDFRTLNWSEASASQPEVGYAQVQTPSVPIPPPTEAEVEGVQALFNLFDPGISFGVLTPSPEFIGVELF